MTKRVPKSAAVLTINEAPKMNARGRQQIARWLHKQADMLVIDGKLYAPKVFTARYRFMPDPNQSSKVARKHMFKPPAVRSPRKRYGR